MSDRKSTLTAVLVDSVSGPAKRIQAEITGIGTSVSRVGAILQGIGQGIGQQLFFALERGISAVIHVIPDLIDQGHAYLDQLHQIQLETGMTAEQTSTLVGALRAMGVPTQDLDTLFARLGKNLATNEGLFRQLGVATRDTDGNLLSSYTIFQNIRRAVSEHGSSLLSTAAAQELFGRSGFKLIEALQASDPEWKAATENVRRWGGVVSQAAIDGADRLGDTIESLKQGITDIGVNIASAVDPYLRAFVDSFASFVQSHLNEIVSFAVQVVNVVTGFISGLLGITGSLDVTAGAAAGSTNKAAAATDNFGKVLKTTAGGADAFTKSVDGQIKAIDAHTRALEQAAERRRAIQERARLQDSLAAAQGQLADLRGNAPFTQGLSNAEQQLAIEKHAQDIIDAEKNVADQRTALGNFEADQKDRAERELLNREKARLQDSLAAHKTANAGILASGLAMDASLNAGLTNVLGNIGTKTQEFAETAGKAFQSGTDAAKTFLTILTGSERALPNGTTVRTGGVVGALGSAADGFRGVFNAIGPMVGVVGTIADAFNDMGNQLNGLASGLQDFGLAIHAFLVNVAKGVGNFGPSIYDILGIRNPFGAAEGAYVKKSPGGSILRVGEGPEDEMVLPLSRLGGLGGGHTTVFEFHSIWPPTAAQAREIVSIVDERMQTKADNSPVGMPAFRGATR